MNKIRLKIKTSDFISVHVDGVVNAFAVAPGIAVNQEGLDWNVTHMPSGVAFVKWLDTKRKAVKLAKQLAALGNWDRPKSKLPKTLLTNGYYLCKEFCRG